MAAVRDNDIPLHMRCTQTPDIAGTVVSRAATATEPEDVDYLMHPLHDWLLAQPETIFGPAWRDLSDQLG